MTDTADYIEPVLDLLGGEDTEFTVHAEVDPVAGEDARVALRCEYNGCKWGYKIGTIPLWELVVDAREHWDQEHA